MKEIRNPGKECWMCNNSSDVVEGRNFNHINCEYAGKVGETCYDLAEVCKNFVDGQSLYLEDMLGTEHVMVRTPDDDLTPEERRSRYGEYCDD